MTVCLMGYAPVKMILPRDVLMYAYWVWLMLVWMTCRYMLHYVLTYGACDSFMIAIGLSLALMQVILIGIGEFLLSSWHILLGDTERYL
jgi:hypothetical protein